MLYSHAQPTVSATPVDGHRTGAVSGTAGEVASSGLGKEDRKDMRALVEVLLQELQPMPDGLRAFFHDQIWPVFGAVILKPGNMLCASALRNCSSHGACDGNTIRVL